MRTWLRVGLLSMCLFIGASLFAQDKGGPEKAEKNEPPPGKYERDSTTMLVHYLLAAIGTLLIMVLICMPIRRD
jgi:hypothetical protein